MSNKRNDWASYDNVTSEPEWFAFRPTTRDEYESTLLRALENKDLTNAVAYAGLIGMYKYPWYITNLYTEEEFRTAFPSLDGYTQRLIADLTEEVEKAKVQKGRTWVEVLAMLYGVAYFMDYCWSNAQQELREFLQKSHDELMSLEVSNDDASLLGFWTDMYLPPEADEEVYGFHIVTKLTNYDGRLDRLKAMYPHAADANSPFRKLIDHLVKNAPKE